VEAFDDDSNSSYRYVAAIDRGLAAVIEGWPTLLDDVRRAIVAMVRAAGCDATANDEADSRHGR
jgi:hypothetical protein